MRPGRTSPGYRALERFSPGKAPENGLKRRCRIEKRRFKE